MRPVRRRFLLATALGLASTGALAIAPAAATATRISATPGRDEIAFRASTDLSGAITGHPGGDGGVVLDLEADPYPYGSFVTAASRATAAIAHMSLRAKSSGQRIVEPPCWRGCFIGHLIMIIR